MTHVLQTFAAQPDFSGFYINELLRAIPGAPKFPATQRPVYYADRLVPSSGALYIAPIPKDGSDPNEQVGQFRDEQEEILKEQDVWDISFRFERVLDDAEIQIFAERLSALRYEGKPRCRTIALIPKTEIPTAVREVALHWKSLAYSHAFRRKSSTSKSPKASSSEDKSFIMSLPIRRLSKPKIKLQSSIPRRPVSPTKTHNTEHKKPAPALLVTSVPSVSDLSQVDTLHPLESADENTSLLPSKSTSHNPDTDISSLAAQDEETALYHLQAASSKFLGPIRESLTWTGRQVSCCCFCFVAQPVLVYRYIG